MMCILCFVYSCLESQEFSPNKESTAIEVGFLFPCIELPQRAIRDRWLARATCPSERLQTQLPLVCQPGCLVVSCLLRFSSQRATRDRWLARATCPSERPQTDMESCNKHGFKCVVGVVWLCSIDPIVLCGCQCAVPQYATQQAWETKRPAQMQRMDKSITSHEMLHSITSHEMIL